MLAGPAPDVAAAATPLAVLEYRGPHDPHDDAKAEETDGEHGIVDAHLFGPSVAPSPVPVEDDQAGKQGNPRERQQQNLGPGLGADGPGR